MNFCTKCGRSLAAGARFCTGCGAVVPLAVESDAVESDAVESHTGESDAAGSEPGRVDTAQPDPAGQAATTRLVVGGQSVTGESYAAPSGAAGSTVVSRPVAGESATVGSSAAGWPVAGESDLAPVSTADSADAGWPATVGSAFARHPAQSAIQDTVGDAAAFGGIAPGSAAVPGAGPRRLAGSRRLRLDGQRATVALVAAAVVVAAAVILGVEVAGHHGRAAAAGHVSRPKDHGSAPASTGASSASFTSPASSVSASSGPTPSPSASPSATPAGGTIGIGPLAAGQPDADQVAAFLSRYYAAIKDRDYAAYAVLFVPGAVPDTAGQFRSGYRSTTDSDVELVSISSSGNGLAASVTFRSHQGAATSITHTACTAWGITFYLQADGSSYLIGSPPAGYQASYQPCS